MSENTYSVELDFAGNAMWFVPHGVNPFDTSAARQAAAKCADAADRLLQIVWHAVNGVEVTPAAILWHFFNLDRAYVIANYYRRSVPGRPVAMDRAAEVDAVDLAKRLRARILEAVVEFKHSPKSPCDGWVYLRDVYAEQFGDRLLPTWADAMSVVLRCDADEKGPRNTTRIYIPPDAQLRPWHPAAWPAVCGRLRSFKWAEARNIRDRLFSNSLPADKGGAAEASPLSGGTKKTRKPRGAPLQYNAADTRRITDAWNTGQYRTYADLAVARGKNEKPSDIRKAIDRQRKKGKSLPE